MKAPAHLTESQKTLWDGLVPEYDLSLASAQAILERAVVAMDRARQAGEVVEREGHTILTNDGKTAAQNPALKTEREMGMVATRCLTLLKQRYPVKHAAAKAKQAQREVAKSPRVAE